MIENTDIQRAFSAVVLRPSARYRQTIIYHFSTAA